MKLKNFIGEFLCTVHPKHIKVMVPMGRFGVDQVELERFMALEFNHQFNSKESIFEREVIKLEYIDGFYCICIRPDEDNS